MEASTEKHIKLDLNLVDGKTPVVPAFSTPCKPEPEVYYGVFVPDPSEVPSDQDIEQVYTEKTACLAVMKKYRGSRFKSFTSYGEALHFAENGPVITLPHSSFGGEDGRCSSLNVEKPSPYRGPKSQDLVKFRKAIEKDDMNYFEQCVNENPRYLVSSGDTPAILQEGSRYNALHVACRTDKPQFVSKVLCTVAEAQFFQKLYPDDTLESSERRSKYLLDAYLNTPDKGLNETPLHFASKHASLKSVQILTSYPDCNKTRKNKFSQTALEIIGTRSKNVTKSQIDDISSLLGDHYYVPLLRDDDYCLLPQVGEPWSPKQDSPGIVTEEQQLLACLSPTSTDSPLSPITPTFKVRGYAGPMSPSQAEVFHRRWRESGVMSPKKSANSPQQAARSRTASLRLTDHEKGLERMGRELASNSGYGWSEYWDFLDGFANLATDEGLSKLEGYLKQKYMQMMMEQHELDSSELREKLNDVADLDTVDSTDSFHDKGNYDNRNMNDSDLSKASQSTMGELCQELEALRLNASLSPQLDSSGHPVISASSKFLQSWRNREEVQRGPDNNDVLNPEDADTQQLSYITKSICVSASRLAEVLGDLAKELQSSAITNLSVGRAVRVKLRPEILCLKNVVSKCITKDLASEIDCGFVHILLAFKAVECVQYNMMPSDLCILAETLRVVVSNLNFVSVNSSDEEDTDISHMKIETKRNNTNHVSCVLRALEKALTIAYNNCSSDMSLDNNENSLRKHLMQLGDCTCCWDSRIQEVFQSSDHPDTIGSSQKYGKAFNFLHQTLFSENQNRDSNENRINIKNSETIIKQLTFEEDGEKVIKATLTVGNGVFDRLQSVEKEINDGKQEEDDSDSFVTAASSVGDNMMTPEEGQKVYINGSEPSKVDADVLTAIEGANIDDGMYPHLSQWLHLIHSHSEDQRNSWTTPIQKHPHPSSAPRLLNNSTPPSHLRQWIPSSAPRVLFRKHTDNFIHSPS